MWEIVAVGDVHEGRTFGIRIDPKTGISERSLDLHDNFKRAAESAIHHGAKLFLVLGDMFDRTHVSPAFRSLIRDDVIEPLARAGIETWILAGNHDQPQNQERGTSIDDFRGYPNVTIFKRQAVEVREIAGKRFGFLVLPYIHPTGIVKLIEERTGERVSNEDFVVAGQRVLKGWMAKKLEGLDVDHVVLLAHYHIVGAKLREVTCPEHLPGEFSISRDMIPGGVELTLLGHIHLHQEVYPGVVYTGSVERADWGEREDGKGYVVVDVNGGLGWRFEELPVRRMIGFKVDVEAWQDVNETVLDALVGELSGAMVRVHVNLPEGCTSGVDIGRISERLDEAGAFHYEVKMSEVGGEKLSISSFSMDPYRLLDDFMRANYVEDPRREGLHREGMDVLREVLG